MTNKNRKIVISLAIFLFLLLVQLYLNFFSPLSVRMGIEAYHIDKFLHFLAGVLFSLVLEGFLPRRSFWINLLFVCLLAIGWEVFEFYSDNVIERLIPSYIGTWVLNVTGDITATILGGIFYWRLSYRKELPVENGEIL